MGIEITDLIELEPLKSLSDSETVSDSVLLELEELLCVVIISLESRNDLFLLLCMEFVSFIAELPLKRNFLRLDELKVINHI